jgi:RND family efflux transporter MFP subunit
MKIKISSMTTALAGATRLIGIGRSRRYWIVAIGLLAALSFSFFPFRHESLGASVTAVPSAPVAIGGAANLSSLGASELNAPDSTGFKASPSVEREFVVGEQVLQSMLSVSGTIEAGDSINVTAPFDGVIQEKHFNFDSLVENRQILLVLDSNEIRLRIQEAKVAKLKTAQALNDLEHWDKSPEVARASRNALSAKLTLEETQRKAAETEVLLTHGIIPRSEYDALLEQVRSQEIQLATANDDLAGTIKKADAINRQIARIESENAAAKYDELMRSVENRTIKAPLTGVISQAYNGSTPALIDRGSHVTKGQAMFNISALSKLGVTARVDEADVTQLEPNQEVDISMSSQDMPPIHGRLSRISAQALPNSGGGPRSALFEIKVDIPLLSEEERRRIRVGMSCSLSIVKYRNLHAMVIPLPYVRRENGASFTWVKVQDGSIQRRLIELGRTTETGIEVLKGLRVGEQVVLREKSEA